jgi:hypothetical protein
MSSNTRQKKKIFGNQPYEKEKLENNYIPNFTNNLVDSVMQKDLNIEN